MCQIVRRIQAETCIGGFQEDPVEEPEHNVIKNACCYVDSECSRSAEPCIAHGLVMCNDPATFSWALHAAPNHKRCAGSGTAPGKNCAETFALPKSWCGYSF